MILPVIPGQLPSGLCPDSYQTLLNAFSAHQSVDVGASSGITLVASSTKPTDQSVAWLRLDQFGRPERVYLFASGAWLSLHPLVPGATLWLFDLLPNFTTYDGGDALALSAISGQMWQLAKNSDGVVIAAKFPVAAGTLPSTTVLAQGAIGGEENHVLIPTEQGSSSYTAIPDDGDAQTGTFLSMQGLTVNGQSITGGSVGPITVNPQADAVGHNNLPNYVVGYLLQRTTRLFYAIT